MTQQDPFVAQVSVDDPQFDSSASSGPASFHRTAAVDNPASFPDLNRFPNEPTSHSRPDLNRRVYQLLLNKHSWMGLQMLYGLADSGASDQEVQEVANHLRHVALNGARASLVQPGIAGAKRGLQGGVNTLQSMNEYTPGVVAGAQGAIAHQKGIINTAEDVVNKADDGFKHIWDDPVLQKNPSMMLAAKIYISNTLGPSPVAGDTLEHAQKQLQLMGYGRDLEATGTMSSGWRGAFAEHTNALYRSQLSGNRPGAISVGHALSALQALTPSSAWPALIGFITHLPDGARMLLSDVAGSFAGLGAVGYATVTGDESSHSEAHGTAASWVNNILGGDHQTPQQNVTDFQENFGKHLLEDGINVIMLSSMLGSGSRFAQAAGTELDASTNAAVAGQLTKDAAARGPGLIARTFAVPGSYAGANLVNPVLIRGATGALIGGGGTALAGGSPAAILGGTVLGGAVGAGSAYDIPVLRRISPVVDKLADSDALYYRLRRFVHTPYTWTGGSPGVGFTRGAIGAATRLTDTAFQQSLLLGGEAQGLGQIQQTLTGDQPGQAPFASSVMNQHTLDSVNDAIAQKLHFNVFGQTIKPSIDDLMFVFAGHGAAAEKLTSSFEVGAWAKRALGASSNSLGEMGLGGMIERLYNGKSTARLIKEFGGSENFNDFWWNRIYDHAANWAATKKFNDTFKDAQDVIPTISDETRMSTIKEYERAIRKSPEQHNEALLNLMAQNHTDELFSRLKTDMRMAPAEFDPINVKPLLDANNHARKELLPLVGQSVGDDLHLNQADDPTIIGVIPKSRLTQQKAAIIEQELEQRSRDLARRELAGTPLNADNPEGQIFEPELFEHANPPTMAEQMHLQQDIDNHIRNLGSDPTMMPQTDKLAWARDFIQRHLPVEITANTSEGQRVIDHLDNLGDGFIPVSSSDISHHLPDTGPWNDITGSLTYRRRLVESLGMNPDEIDDRHINAAILDRQITELKKLQDQGHYFGPGETPQSIIELLRMNGAIKDTSLKGKIAAAFDSRRNLNDLLKNDPEDLDDPIAHALAFRDMKRKDFVKALMDPETYRYRHQGNFDMFNYYLEAEGNHTLVPEWMTEDTANAIYQGMLKGYSGPGFRMNGLSNIDSLARSSMSWMGGTPILPDKLSYAMANLPNRLLQMRDTWRFDLSPMFDIRRVIKTNMKFAPFGIGVTRNPIKDLMDAGKWEQAKAALAEAQPDRHMGEALGWTDEAKRYLDAHSVLGWYNAEGYKAWAAYDMKHVQGLPTEEVSKNLDTIFSYGKRTPLERSTNFLFFPFSFEKSLYKIMGSYLLDKPAQRLLLTRGMAAYDQFNKDHMDGSNPLATSFWHQHFPLLDEVAKVNAFTSGISAGEPGGINRPLLLNLFMPQSWAPSAYNQGLLERFIPAMRDFERIYAEGLDQSHIAHNFAINTYKDMTGQPATISDPRLPVVNQYDDLSQAFKLDLDLNNFYHDAIAKGIKIPISPEWGSEFSGRTMTKQVIREIVAKAHPTYKAEGAAAYVQHTNSVFDTYKASLSGKPGKDGKFHDVPKLPDGTPKLAYVTKFQEMTNSLAYELANTNKPGELTKRTEQLRDAAKYLAENDSEFYKLYRTTFLRVLGPLEGVK